MSNEEKIKELETRIEALEKIEKDRKRKRIIAICIKIVFYTAILVVMFILIMKLKTYYDQISNLKNTFNLDSSSIKDFDISNYFQGLFN